MPGPLVTCCLAENCRCFYIYSWQGTTRVCKGLWTLPIPTKGHSLCGWVHLMLSWYQFIHQQPRVFSQVQVGRTPTIWASPWQNHKMGFATSEGLDQSAYQISLNTPLVDFEITHLGTVMTLIKTFAVWKHFLMYVMSVLCGFSLTE